jgi:hypothetical protein
VKVGYSDAAGRIEKFTEFSDKDEAAEFYGFMKRMASEIVLAVQLFKVKEITG